MVGNPDFKFQVLKANGNEKTDELFIEAGTEYTVYDANGTVLRTDRTDADGVFTLKAGQRAEFTGIDENRGKYYVRELLDGTLLDQYGQITVSGETTSRNYNVTVGSDTFTGVESPIKDMSDGATAFRFDNAIEQRKLGSLSITKALQPLAAGETPTGETYTFNVSLDGALLPAGTEYTLRKADGTEATVTVQNSGQVSLMAGQTVIIPKILAGTSYDITETDSPKYNVTYSPGKTGIIAHSQEVRITATNTEVGVAIDIPVRKTLQNPDGLSHSYTISFQPVKDPDGRESDGDPVTWTAAFDSGTDNVQDHAFRVTYRPSDFDGNEKTFYYLVTERADAAESYTDFDENVYIVSVKVTKTVSGGTKSMTAQVVSEFGTAGKPVGFVNSLKLASLELKKTVSGGTTEQEFQFAISLSYPGLNATYTGVKLRLDGTTDGQTYAVSFTNGDAQVSVRLKHGESFKIDGLPSGTQWTAMETNAEGFRTQYKVNQGSLTDGPAAGGTLTTGNTCVEFVNTVLYELPITGGAGTMAYTAGGAGLMALAILMYIGKRFGRRRDAESK